MSKTDLTRHLERVIFSTTQKMGTFGCLEVTIGFGYNKERVDYLTFDTNGIWRCYEIKVSKSDFHSKASNTFVGHYNYYVMTKELYEQVKVEIPIHVGVYIEDSCVKRAKKQELQVSEDILKMSMIRSLARDVQKIFKSEDDTLIERKDRQIQSLKRERDKYKDLYLSLK